MIDVLGNDRFSFGMVLRYEKAGKKRPAVCDGVYHQPVAVVRNEQREGNDSDAGSHKAGNRGRASAGGK